MNERFASKLVSSYEHVMMYEEVSLKQKALSVIPVARLKEQANTNFVGYTSLAKSSESTPPLDFEDFLLVELLAWFKNEFFTWTDKPNCVKCKTNQSMNHVGMKGPNNDEIWGMANRVEVYQ